MQRWNWAIAESVGWCIGGILLSVITYYMPISGGSEGWVPTIARVRIEEDIVGEMLGANRVVRPVVRHRATYSYMVGGRTYTGIPRDAAREVDIEHRDIVIYYNPYNPAEFVLKRGHYPTRTQVIASYALLFGGLVVGAARLALRRVATARVVRM